MISSRSEMRIPVTALTYSARSRYPGCCANRISLIRIDFRRKTQRYRPLVYDRRMFGGDVSRAIIHIYAQLMAVALVLLTTPAGWSTYGHLSPKY